MKKGGGRRVSMLGGNTGAAGGAAAGFTIVEVMVVLAVTGVLFISGLTYISGRQARTQFTTGINLLQQQIQQIINETASGYYPQNTAFSCARGASAPPTLNTQTAGDHQGQNPDCIFMGKVLQFGVKSTDPQAYQIIPVVGNRLDTTASVDASSLYGSTGSLPEAAAAGTTATTNFGLTGADTRDVLTQGLTVVAMWYGTDRTQVTGAVGFISSLPSPDGVSLASGTQTLNLYRVASTSLGQTTPQVADALYPGMLNTQPLQSTNSVSICVASGGTNQSGLITIGQRDASVASNLAVTLTIYGGKTC